LCREQDARIDYRDPETLRSYVSEHGQLIPRRISGNCADHQREITLAVKRARALALVPYAVTDA
jgi:small subunit ribosomal protein S18